MDNQLPRAYQGHMTASIHLNFHIQHAVLNVGGQPEGAAKPPPPALPPPARALPRPPAQPDGQWQPHADNPSAKWCSPREGVTVDLWPTDANTWGWQVTAGETPSANGEEDTEDLARQAATQAAGQAKKTRTPREPKPPKEGPAYGEKITAALQAAGKPLSVNSLAQAAGISWHITNRVSGEMAEAGTLRRLDDPAAHGQGKAKLLWLPGALPEGWVEAEPELVDNSGPEE